MVFRLKGRRNFFSEGVIVTTLLSLLDANKINNTIVIGLWLLLDI